MIGLFIHMFMTIRVIRGIIGYYGRLCRMIPTTLSSRMSVVIITVIVIVTVTTIVIVTITTITITTIVRLK